MRAPSRVRATTIGDDDSRPEGEDDGGVDAVAEQADVGQPGVEGDLLAGVDVAGAVGAIAEQPGVAQPERQQRKGDERQQQRGEHLGNVAPHLEQGGDAGPQPAADRRGEQARRR